MTHRTSNTASISCWFYSLGTLAIFIGFLWVGRDFLIPLAITGLLYILSSALVDRIRTWNLYGWSPPNWLAHIASIAIVIGAVLIVALVVSSSAEDIYEALPRYKERLIKLGEDLKTFAGPKTTQVVLEVTENLDIGSLVSTTATQAGGLLSTLGITTLYLVFLMTERIAWTEKLPRLVSSPSESQRAQIVLRKISVGVKQYMWVNTVTSAMSGTVAFVIFKWVDLDFASLLALTVFLAGFIPNIGALIAVSLPSIIALIQFDSLTPFLIVLFGYGAADQFIANVIQPSMQGRSLNLSTFMVMVSLTFWATIWGGIGAFLAIPMMVVMMVICSELPSLRWIAVLLSGDSQLLKDRETDA